MKKRLFNNPKVKDIFRTIWKTQSRFLAIVVMIALGTAALVGIVRTSPNLRENYSDYAKEVNLEDIRVLSYLGFEEEDYKIINELTGLKNKEYIKYAYAYKKGTDDIAQLLSENNKISKYKLTEGRMPEKEDEIAIDTNYDAKIGSIISFEEDEKNKDDSLLKRHQFKVVGKVFSTEQMKDRTSGYANIGDGDIDLYGVIKTENFNKSAKDYIALLDFQEFDKYKYYDKKLDSMYSNKLDEIRDKFLSRPDELKDKIRKEANEDIKSAENEIQDAKNKIEDGKNKLADARKELDDSWKKYEDGKSEARNKFTNSKRLLDQGQDKLDQGERDYKDGLKRYKDGQEKYKAGLSELNESKRKLDSAKTLIEKGEKEFSKGEKTLRAQKEKLDSARKELDEGSKKLNEQKIGLNKNKTELESYIRDLENNESSLKGKLKQVDENLKLLSSSMETLKQLLTPLYQERKEKDASISSMEQILASKKNELIDINSKIKNLDPEDPDYDEKYAQLDAQKKQISTEIDDLSSNLTNLKSEKEILDTSIEKKENEKRKIQENIDKYKGQKNYLNSKIKEIEKKKSSLLTQLGKINSAISGIKKRESSLPNERAKLQAGQKKYEEALKKFNEEKSNFELKKAQYLDGLKKYEAATALLKEKKIELDGAKNTIENSKIKLDKARKDLEKSKSTYLSQKKKVDDELKENYLKLMDGEEEYKKGKSEFDDKEKEGLSKIQDGENDIKNAREDLAKLEIPDYKISSAYDNRIMKLQLANADSLEVLAYIFPTIFYLIALMISIITMTRMVEDERVQIGTLKSLGYSRKEISRKYYIYGTLSSLLGGILGLLVGFYLVLPIILKAYMAMALVPMKVYPWNVKIIILSGLIAFACTILPISYVIRRSMREQAAMLLRPKQPKKVKKSLLEFFPFVWKKLSFLWKVTFRNLAISKVKVFMTIFGVAGCTGLLIMGFAIKSSVKNISKKQFEDVYKYDALMIYNAKANNKELKDLDEDIKDKLQNGESIKVMYDQVTIKNLKGNIEDISLFTVNNEERFRNFISLKNRKSGENLHPDDGAVISEKLSENIGKKIGDIITIQDEKGRSESYVIRGISEQYFEHSMVVNAKTRSKTRGHSFLANAIIFNFDKSFNVETFKREIMDNPISESFVINDAENIGINSLMGSLNIVVAIIILLSASLSLVVLFNLSNLNLSERKRELSTVKVLGFRPSELTMYIYRETLVLAMIGGLLGIALGRALHYFIVVGLSPGSLMLDRTMMGRDILVSLFITTTFILFMMFIFHKKLKKIDMVEALKAVE